MAAYNSIDLARLGLASGEGRRLDVEVDPGELELAGERYAFVPTTPAHLEISRTAAGHALHLTFAGDVVGPCTRCLAEARVGVEVDAREVDQPGSRDDELASPYVADDVLDLLAWSRDAVALALPSKLLCRPECAGLCPVCGASLNDADPEEHRHGSRVDPRWEPLRGLKLE
jgi:uncharacterized protein